MRLQAGRSVEVFISCEQRRGAGARARGGG